MRFQNIVSNLKQLTKLGDKIISHKKNVTHMCQNLANKENNRQYERIEEFEKLFKTTTKEWKRNRGSINKYWTGY